MAEPVQNSKSTVDIVSDGVKWVIEQTVNMTFSGFNWCSQTISASAKEAREVLVKEGADIVATYGNSQTVTARKIKEVCRCVLRPLQELQVIGGGSTLAVFLAACYVPSLIRPFCLAAGVASSYFTFQIWTVKSAVYEEFAYYERQGNNPVSKDKFIKDIGDLGDRILARSDLAAILAKLDTAQRFTNLGDWMKEVIDAQEGERVGLMRRMSSWGSVLGLNYGQAT